MVTLALELMDDGHNHELPFYGLPTVGPYRDFGAANSLGMRVEWKHWSLPKWFSAPLQIGARRHRKIGIALLKGDGSQIERLYQEATALVQMIRGEECPNAPEGFWIALCARGSRATIQRLEVDHLQQSICWAPQLPRQVAPPTRATAEENRKLLYKNPPAGRHTAVGIKPARNDAIWYYDSTSTKSAAKDPVCDTCTIISKCRSGPNLKFTVDCNYDPEIQACPTCKAMNRICTFTPVTPLLSSWVGREIDPADYINAAKMVLFPSYGAGPARNLVSHLGMEKDVHIITEIPEPPGWESLFPWLDLSDDTSGDQSPDATEMDGNDGYDDGDSD